MAKTLMAKLEEKWLQLLPKFTEEEKRLEEEEAEAKLNMQLAEEVARAKMARDLSNVLYEVDMHLEERRDMVVQKCRKMSTEEKAWGCRQQTISVAETVKKVLLICVQVLM